jgi:ketosteroid isomerase-like protein
MTENKRTLERYMDGFNKGDHEQILSCLADDIVWEASNWTSGRTPF